MQDFIKEMNWEKREREKAKKRVHLTTNQKVPWIVKFDNWLHDVVGAPRNYK
jgi:hypothetical protein